MTFSKNLKSKKIARNKSDFKSIKRGGERSRGSRRTSISSPSSRASSPSSRDRINSLNGTQQVDTTSLRERILESQRFYKKFVTRLDNQMTVGKILKLIKTAAKEVYKDFSPDEINRFTKYKYEELSQLLTFM